MKKNFLIIIFLSFSLTACLGVKFTYNNLDWFIPWYLDDYIILDGQQENTFENQLEIIWKWHRQQELSEYSKLLDEIVVDLKQQKINHERLFYYSNKLRGFYYRIINKSLDQGSILIASLSDTQVIEILDSIADNDEEFKEYVADTNLTERIRERRKSISKTFRKWIGRLSKVQEARIQRWANESETTLEFHVEYVAKTQKVFKNILSQRNNFTQTKERILSLTTQPEILRNEDYNKAIERNSQRFRQLIIDTINSLSKKQQQLLLNKIINHSNDFSELAAKS